MKRFFARVGRFFWSWGFLKFVLIAITLIILLYVEEDWRGARAWAATKAKWEARGVSFDPNAYIPPLVPDAENLAALPLFKMQPDPDPDPRVHGTLAPLTLRRAFANNSDAHPLPPLGDWQRGKAAEMEKIGLAIGAEYAAAFPGRPVPKDLSTHFAALYPFVGDLREASATRPFCRFEQSYTFDSPYSNDFGLVTAQIGVSKVLTADAVAALASNRSDQALDDFTLNNKLTRGLMDQPILVSGLVAIGMTAINLGSIYDGLAWHAWNDVQLAEIEGQLGRLDFVGHYQRVMRGEAIIEGIPALDRIRSEWSMWTLDRGKKGFYKDNLPSLWANGWIDLWKVGLVDRDLTASTWVDPNEHQVFPRKVNDAEADANRRLASYTIYLPWNFLFRIAGVDQATRATSTFSKMQVWVDETRIACALGRYRLAHGVYPMTLDALAPAYIDALPHDIMNGELYHYRLNADGTFLLYSVGWNQVDDGGKVVMKQDNPNLQDYTQGDWVWPMAKW